ncbi:MAG: hypothetical protein WEB33_02665 [Bacteroidota bacterium]
MTKRVIVLFFLIFSSCAVFSPSVKFGSAILSVDEMQNGFLVEIRLENPVSDVSTTLPGSRWLIITVPDTLLDTAAVAAFRSREVDSTEVRRFETATQFALRFTKPITSTDMIRGKDRRTILLSVFF